MNIKIKNKTKVRITFKDNNYKNPEINFIDIDNYKDSPFDAAFNFQGLKRKGVLPYFEYKANDLDLEFLKLVSRGGSLPVFKSKSSDNCLLVGSNNFVSYLSKVKQFSDWYFMPVMLRDLNANGIKTKTYTDYDGNKKEVKKSYVQTRQKDIKAVNVIMLDIDISHKEDSDDYSEMDFKRISDAIIYFAELENLPIPTAVIYTGRGLQLIFMAEKPLYMNSPAIKKLLVYCQNMLKDVYNKKVLLNIESIKSVSCDDAVGVVSQKMRLPGSVNTKSGTRAHVIYLEKNNQYDFGDLLTEIVGPKEDKLEKRNKSQRKKTYLTGAQIESYNNNIVVATKKRIKDISDSLVFYANNVSTCGCRNQTYMYLIDLCLAASYSKAEIENLVFSLDDKLPVPYFKNMSHFESMYKSRSNVIKPGRKISNKTLEENLICVKAAIKEGLSLSILGIPTRAEVRNKKRLKRRSLNIGIIEAIMDSDKSAKEIADEFECSLAKVYYYKKIYIAIAEDVYNKSRTWKRLKKQLRTLSIKNVEFWTEVAKTVKKKMDFLVGSIHKVGNKLFVKYRALFYLLKTNWMHDLFFENEDMLSQFARKT